MVADEWIYKENYGQTGFENKYWRDITVLGTVEEDGPGKRNSQGGNLSNWFREHAGGSCDTGSCTGQVNMVTDDLLWRPLISFTNGMA